MLIPGECPRQRDLHIQSVPGVSRDSKEEDPGAGARVGERECGRCQSMLWLARNRTGAFILH